MRGSEVHRLDEGGSKHLRNVGLFVRVCTLQHPADSCILNIFCFLSVANVSITSLLYSQAVYGRRNTEICARAVC